MVLGGYDQLGRFPRPNPLRTCFRIKECPQGPSLAGTAFVHGGRVPAVVNLPLSAVAERPDFARRSPAP